MAHVFINIEGVNKYVFLCVIRLWGRFYYIFEDGEKEGKSPPIMSV